MTNFTVTRAVTGTYGEVSVNAIEFPMVDLTSPDGGENLTVNNTHTITWTHSDASIDHNLEIRLCKNNCDQIANYNGSAGGMLINTSNATLNSYNWRINKTIDSANPLSDTARIAIVDVTKTAWASTTQTSRNWDIANGNFKIRGNVTVSSPNGPSDVWNVGDTNRVISWDKRGDLGGNTFNISLYNTSGTIWNQTINSSVNQTDKCGSEDACSYTWPVVPDTIRDDLRIKIAWGGDATNYTDLSDGNFTVKGKLQVNQPNASTTWNATMSVPINWTKWGNWTHPNYGDNKVNITYVKGGTEYNIANNTSGTSCVAGPNHSANCTYTWGYVDPNAVGAGIVVRITSLQSNAALVATNDSAAFSVTPYLEVIKPPLGNVTKIGQVLNITWNLYGPVTESRVYYSKDGGSTWPINVTSNDTTGKDNFTYNWTVPEGNWSSNARIRVTKNATGSPNDVPYDDSDAFKIVPTINITNPYLGQLVRVNGSVYVNFTVSSDLQDHYVSIAFYKAGAWERNISESTLINNKNMSVEWKPVNGTTTSLGTIVVSELSDPLNITNTSLNFTSRPIFPLPLLMAVKYSMWVKIIPLPGTSQQSQAR